MKLRPYILALLLLAWCAAAGAQAKRELRGKVFSLGENGEDIPEKVLVTLEETGGSDDTNDLGIFFIALPAHLKAGHEVTLIVNKPGWRVRDKKTPIPSDLNKTVEVELLPNDSKLFWTHGRIERFIRETAEKAKQQVNPAGQPEKIDFSRYLKDWAVQYGFSAPQAKEEIDKWIAEIEQKQDNFYQLGLAAFAKNNFGEAGKLFQESADAKASQLAETQKQKQALAEKEEKLTAEVVRDLHLAGSAHYNNYAFEKALAAYQQALGFVDRKKSPERWFDLTIAVGEANWALGIQAEGDKIKFYLNAAVEASQSAAQAFTRESDAERWATAQGSVGNALSQQGTRTGGEEGAKLLKASVTALKASLEVRTLEHLPVDWAQSQNNLATTYTYLEDWPNVAACFANVLKVYPDYEEAYQTAGYLYHEVLFEFSEAFIINQNWLAQHSDDLSAQCDFAEKHFTTGRFAECEQRLAALLANSEIEQSTKIALRAIQIANTLALGQPAKIPAKLDALQATIASQPDTFKVSWTFNGTKHFISSNEKLASYREWLLQLFQTLEIKEGREAILAALREVREGFNDRVGNKK